MIKERQRAKCSSVDKKGKNNKILASSNTSTYNLNNNGTLNEHNFFEKDVYINEESFEFIGDISDTRYNRSSSSVACSYTNSRAFAMDMCPIDIKLDGNTFGNSNLSACKSLLKREDIIGADVNFSPDFMLDGVQLPSPCKQRKTEYVLNSNLGFPPDSCDGMLPSIINKGSSIDAQYMQHQNQIFVFSTKLANESAESVKKGHYPSIIDYHCAQPETKKFLQRYPLKMNQFNRQSASQWMNNLTMKQKAIAGVNSKCGMGKGYFRNNPMLSSDVMNNACGGPAPSNMNMPSRMPMWNQQSNINPMNSNNQHPQICNNNMMVGGGPNTGSNSGPLQMNSMMTGSMGSNQATMVHGIIPPMKCSSQPPSIDMISDTNPNSIMSNSVLPPPHASLANFNDDQFPSSPRALLTGIKIPDENLTPSQKTQRDQKLATLKKLGQMLMPEGKSDLQQSQHNPVDDISSVLIGDGGSSSQPMTLADSEDSSAMPNTTNATVNNGLGGNSNSGPMTPGPPADWQTMPPVFDERGKRLPDVSNMSRCSGSRSQGPPPPYHQNTRSASVPISAQSPNPNSPGNATSNLSLPSPRTCSGLNSPAPKQGSGPSPTTSQINTSIGSPGQPHNRNMNISNPGTPVSANTHLSPNAKTPKDTKMCSGLMSNEFSPAPSGQQSPGPDAVYSRSLQTLARQQQQKPQPVLPHTQAMQSANSHCKEPSLMPVPSPQTIQYMNAFEAQELIIQKQPNTSLKVPCNMVSPSLSQSGLDSMISVTADSSCLKVSVSNPNTPLTPSSLDLPSSKFPNTPSNYSAVSPGPDNKPQMRSNNASQMKNDLRFACNSPQMLDKRFQPNNAFMSQSNKNNFLDPTPPEKMTCAMTSDKDANSCVGSSGPNFPRSMMPNNIPIDPAGAPKSSFDPISSLTQMSQQLNNNVPSLPGNPVGMMHSNMIPYNSNTGLGSGPMTGPGPNPGQSQPNNINMKQGPSMGGSYPPMMSNNAQTVCMMRPPGPMSGSYNNTNVQVKPNAPNTIQYLPNRPQNVGVGTRGPPSLEFLRYQNSNTMPGPPMDKLQPHNMNYFSGNYPSGAPPGTNMNDMMSNMNCAMPQGPGNQLMRGPNGPPPPPNMMRMGGGNMGLPPYSDQMYGGPGPIVNMQPNNSCHMFIPNTTGGPAGVVGHGSGVSKMPPMAMSGNMAPDATQPLPPSMGQPNNCKNPYMGQTQEMNDPQYRQQFHNFQQQLYATNTRSHMSNQPMAASSQQYFVPK